MPKERNNRVFSCRTSRAHSPYQLNAYPLDREVPHVNPSDSGRSLSKKDWEDALCPICMNPPHNAVLLLCSSHEKGCRTYMCDSSYRHSNCLDQFNKMHTPSGLIPTEQNSDILDESSHPQSDSQSYLRAGDITDTSPANEELFHEGFEPDAETDLNTHGIPQLTCPLCRGQVKGWTVVEQARKYLNMKSRTCSQESCSVEGTYGELRKHARLVHPLARPAEVDPDRQRDWQQLEEERNISDVISSIRSAIPGAMMFGDYVVEDGNNEGNGNYFPGDERNWWSFLLLVQYLDQNAHITISRAISPRVRARGRGRGRFGRTFALREESSEAGTSAQGIIAGSNARNNDRFGRTFSLRVDNSEAGANAQGNVSSSNARVRLTDFSTESSSRSSTNAQGSAFSSDSRVHTTESSTESSTGSHTTDFSTESSTGSSSTRQRGGNGFE